MWNIRCSRAFSCWVVFVLRLHWLYLYAVCSGSSFQISVAGVMMAAFPRNTAFSYSRLHISLFLLCGRHPGNTARKHPLCLHISFACCHVDRCLLLGRKAMTSLDKVLKSRDITLPTKIQIVKAMVFPVVMYGLWELDPKEGWVPKDWCFRTVMLEKILESPLESKEINPVNPKGNQPCMFIGRIDTEAETPILWPPDAKDWLIGKDPDAGKDWRQEKKAGGLQGDPTSPF